MLEKYRETVNPHASPAIVLFAPSQTAHPYYAEFGWVPATGSTARLPDQNTVWQQEGSGPLTPTNPVTLKYDNGEGLTFRHTIMIDDHYLFTIKDDVTNVGTAPVTLYPFALILRAGTPRSRGYYILHEGLIGYLGDQGLQEVWLSQSTSTSSMDGSGSPINIGRRRCCPTPPPGYGARFSSNLAGTNRTYQTDYLLDAQTIPIGGSEDANARLFAGAKERAWSASTSLWSASAATTSSSASITSTC